MEEVGGAPQPPIDTFGGPFRGKHVAPRPRVASSPDRFRGRACRSATAESHPDEEYCRRFTRDKIPRLRCAIWFQRSRSEPPYLKRFRCRPKNGAIFR
jgi:hypothetical protein